MELEFAPEDDSLFEEVTEKQQKPLCEQSYYIKNCHPLVISIYALKIKSSGDRTTAQRRTSVIHDRTTAHTDLPRVTAKGTGVNADLT